MDEINLTNQAPDNPTPPPARPKNWLVESILVTVLCCLPFGIVGIIYAAGVNSKYDAGNYPDALESSRQAGKWTKIGFFVGIAGIVLYVLFFVILGFGAMWSQF
ncbi:interferon-induced transmembrane protein [Anseongella ginsenosidimutans]|uniref:Interferon-induced transmembrane protein n=1 Tax=Anseongella ginsenosidimutans TaxID=496056 RepID=A0A4R3KS85_9SPHI|nr:CD225/dispanin family protein [Anseongella ginsenosidimutans]QEC52632.1 CD225/dispanin family protein [Anseongella ginsenosidimutans]TCS86555.1 interferon-induced transmembrane protein [Anseongella ginsenosidimutans]